MKLKKTKRGFLIDAYLPGLSQRIRKVIPASNRAEALLMWDSIRLNNLEGQSLLPKRKASSPAVGIAFENYLQLQSASKCLDAQRIDRLAYKHFLSDFDKRQIDLISETELGKAVEKTVVRLQLQPASVNRYLGSLKSFLSWVNRTGLTRIDLGAGLKLRKGPSREARALSRLEIIRLIDGSQNPLKLQLKLGISLGLRRGEIASLRWDSIDVERKLLRIGGTEHFTTKNGRSRTIPLGEKLLMDLLSYQGNPDSSLIWIFPNKEKSGPLNPQVITRAMSRLTKRLELSNVRFHDGRATAAVGMAEQGCADVFIARLTGHTSLAMARKYVNGSLDDFVRGKIGFLEDKVYREETKIAVGQNESSGQNSDSFLTILKGGKS